MRTLAKLVLISALLLQTACVSMQTVPYQPGIESNAALARHRNGAPLRVGAFSADAKLDQTPLRVRGSTLKGGPDGKFSTYLRDAVVAELGAAGRLDADAATEIRGELLGHHLDASRLDIGRAEIMARFVVSRDGKTLYDRTLAQPHLWPSSLVGAIAIPAAFDNYAATVQKLLRQLFSDPMFEQATAR